MANLVITYWRDIPSAVSVKIGRTEEKRMLDNRFMEAIDMAAMRDGATNTDDYLADWRRGAPQAVGDDLAAEADKAKAELETRYTQERIKALIGNGGREPA
jgi:Virulence factor